MNLKIRSIVTPYGEIKEDASLTLKSIYKSIGDLERSIQSKIHELLKNYDECSQILNNILLYLAYVVLSNI